MTESLHVACSSCLTVNRVPASRLRQSPKCGHCHQNLFQGNPIPLSQNTFHKWLRNTDVPIVIDFWAPWCGPCRTMAPAFEQAARDLAPDALLGKVDTETEPGLGNEFGIRSIPTMVLFRRGKEISRHSGAIGADQIVRWVRAALTK